ncbi:MAG TPA: hypothetical protein VFB73_04655 [Chloroflexota bacterium]|nr:hypothetical protein [Chloroflexota bacterium]
MSLRDQEHREPVTSAHDCKDVQQYMVIVHPAGAIDDDGAARYWTEVPAMSACSADGTTLDEAVKNTRAAIIEWISRTSEETSVEVNLQIELAL